MSYLKFLIILKEIKKPSGTFMRVLAKNQLRFEKSWEIFIIYIGKSKWKIDFLPIFSPIFQDLSFNTALENYSIFLQQFFWFGGGGFYLPPLPPAGAPVICIRNYAGKHFLLKLYIFRYFDIFKGYINFAFSQN